VLLLMLARIVRILIVDLIILQLCISIFLPGGNFASVAEFPEGVVEVIAV
jgi:hypothetical protein